MSPKRVLVLIIFITLVSAYIAFPKRVTLPADFPVLSGQTLIKPDLDLRIGNFHLHKSFALHTGLDLQGGTQVILEADMTQIDPSRRQDALQSAESVIKRRVDLYGVSEPLIQTSITDTSYRIIVELPGVTDVDEATALIGQTALLDFRELTPEATSAATLFDFMPTGLTGQHLDRAEVVFGVAAEPQVSLLFNKEGADLFSAITSRNLNKPVGIFLDGLPLTTPLVNQPITGGQAVITGAFTLEDAKNLSIQLNAGALPVPVNIIEQRNIGATLGADSIRQSIFAGLIGLIMVMLFMFLYYGWLGLLANIALLIYAVLTLALYKIIPVTVTLPGLAGFILSVGMAVDSNILIFERIKEELRLGKSWRLAMENGFGKAWDSIKDANVITLLTAFILFNPLNWTFLNTSGLVRGFALTLFLGIVISLFTGIIVTRTLIRIFYKGGNISLSRKNN